MKAAALEIRRAGAPDDLLITRSDLRQAEYLRTYLADLNATSILVEPHYFDRDYLSEFSSFYCTSSAGYPNVCERHHYFSCEITRDSLERAARGDAESVKSLSENYLGFVVKRPIPATPLGRTVVRWYPDETPSLPRVVHPSRTYACHVAGIQLDVNGLAWQQQDAGVGACATVALWSMLHSSAFDDRHVVPTTAEVTKAAHSPGLSAFRAFPSRGLTFSQLIATVRDFGFAPLVVAGDKDGEPTYFSREHFCAALASLVRSGFPVLMTGDLFDAQGKFAGAHAVCCVGFRQASAGLVPAGEVVFEDTGTGHVYVHDDNLGPAVRFRVGDENGRVVLETDSPKKTATPALADPTVDYPSFLPTALLVAAHDDIRITPDHLHVLALKIGRKLCTATSNKLGLSIGSRILRLADYVGSDLEKLLASTPNTLGATRLRLWETVPPMSLHVGVTRFGYQGSPVMDVLYDTTDSEPNMRAFCHIVYHPVFARLVSHVDQVDTLDLGVLVPAFDATDAPQRV